MDMILLYIDNCALTLARVLKVVRDHEHDFDLMVVRVRLYITVEAVGDMLRSPRRADRDTAKYLRKEMAETTKSDRYWSKVAEHYLNKHKEGCRMEEYLDSEWLKANY